MHSGGDGGWAGPIDKSAVIFSQYKLLGFVGEGELDNIIQSKVTLIVFIQYVIVQDRIRISLSTPHI